VVKRFVNVDLGDVRIGLDESKADSALLQVGRSRLDRVGSVKETGSQ
jgi:hypothetical protein